MKVVPSLPSNYKVNLFQAGNEETLFFLLIYIFWYCFVLTQVNYTFSYQDAQNDETVRVQEVKDFFCSIILCVFLLLSDHLVFSHMFTVLFTYGKKSCKQINTFLVF